MFVLLNILNWKVYLGLLYSDYFSLMVLLDYLRGGLVIYSVPCMCLSLDMGC